MLIKLASLAILAVAAVSEPMTYKMSTRELFGLERRQGDGSYQPTQTFCGLGATCAEACGAGFNMCPSTDNAIHCYNVDAKQSCCSDGTGNSCDANFYCAGSVSNGTVCCPNGQSPEACAKAYGISGALSSETSAATAYPTASASSDNATSTPYITKGGPSATYPSHNSTKSAYPTTTPSTLPSNAASALAPGVALLVFAPLVAFL